MLTHVQVPFVVYVTFIHRGKLAYVSAVPVGGVMLWMDGSLVGYSDWKDRHPSLKTNIGTVIDKDYWYSATSSTSSFGYLCEKVIGMGSSYYLIAL